MTYSASDRPWRDNALLAAWRAGRPTLNGWLAIPSGVSAEAMAAAGWDSLTLDLQHGMIDQADVLPLLQALHGWPVTPLVRVPALDPGLIMKVLDLGAYGVICPLIDTPEQAAELVAACRYPPHGRRSFGPVRASLSIGADYARRADQEILCLAMIETRSALERVAEICAVPGLSGIYIGPADLSLALGVAPGFDPQEPVVCAAIERIIGCARTAGIWVGVHNATPAYARRMVALGAHLVTVGSDLRLLGAAASQTVQAFRAGGAAHG